MYDVNGGGVALMKRSMVVAMIGSGGGICADGNDSIDDDANSMAERQSWKQC